MGVHLAIRLEKEYYIDLPREDVWHAIQNPDILAQILPNCQSLEPKGENQFTAHIDVKVGPVRSKFQSSFEIFDIHEPEGYKFLVRGNGKNGSMNGRGEIKLHSNENGTNFTFIAEGNVAGILSRVGQRLIEVTGKKLMDQGFENFKNRVIENNMA